MTSMPFVIFLEAIMVTFTGGNSHLINTTEANILLQYNHNKLVTWIQKMYPQFAPIGKESSKRNLVELEALCVHFTALGNHMPSKKQCHQYLSAYRRYRNPKGVKPDLPEFRAFRIHLKLIGISPSNKHQAHRLEEGYQHFINIYRGVT
jgi:hypothetical protein